MPFCSDRSGACPAPEGAGQAPASQARLCRLDRVIGSITVAGGSVVDQAFCYQEAALMPMHGHSCNAADVRCSLFYVKQAFEHLA